MGEAKAQFVGHGNETTESFQIVTRTNDLFGPTGTLACSEIIALVSSAALTCVAHGVPGKMALMLMAVGTIIYVGGLSVLGIYPGRGMWGPVRIRFRALMSGIAFVPTAIIGLFMPSPSLGNGTIDCLLFGTILFVLSSFIELLAIHVADKAGIWRSNAVLIGDSSLAADLKRDLAIFPELGFELIGGLTHRIGPGQPSSIHPGLFLGSHAYAYDKTLQLPIFYPVGHPSTHARHRQPTALARIVKRVFDIVVSLLGLVFVMPLLAAVAVCICLCDGWPFLYAQTRGGLGGRSIRVWKFRSMYRNAQDKLEELLASDPEKKAEWNKHFKLREDPRILPGIGKFVRRTSIDELPQLFSVLVGDMSLIGPRPFPENHLAVFSQEFRKLRASVMPGLSGLWQVTLRSSGSIKDQEDLDRIYVCGWSIWVDLYIAFRTPVALLMRNGAM